jgi:hypothetical protein
MFYRKLLNIATTFGNAIPSGQVMFFVLTKSWLSFKTIQNAAEAVGASFSFVHDVNLPAGRQASWQ